MRRGLVLDIETAPDPELLEACDTTARAAQGRIWLHRLAAYALFAFCEDDEGRVSGFELASALVAPAGFAGSWPCEADALARIEAALAALGEDGIIVSFNGRRHDLPFLTMRRRCCRVFAPSHLARFGGRTNAAHIDMMEELAVEGLRWPSLHEACAAMAIPHAPHDEISNVPAQIRKSESDVLATFLLYLFTRAAQAGAARCLDEGWASLAAWCLAQPRARHRLQFATAPAARAALRTMRIP